MTYHDFSTRLISILIGTAITSFSAMADIRQSANELNAEEMTSAYIRDTTVILRQQPIATEPMVNSNDEAAPQTVQVRVARLDDLYSDMDNIDHSALTQSLAALDDNVLQALMERREQQLRQQESAYDNGLLDPNLAQSEAYLRQVLNIPANQPIDYSNLGFPADLPIIVPPSGIEYTNTTRQFTLAIPNNGYAEQAFQTPGGEYQVNITPDQIQFTINLPGQ